MGEDDQGGSVAGHAVYAGSRKRVGLRKKRKNEKSGAAWGPLGERQHGESALDDSSSAARSARRNIVNGDAIPTPLLGCPRAAPAYRWIMTPRRDRDRRTDVRATKKAK